MNPLQTPVQNTGPGCRHHGRRGLTSNGTSFPVLFLPPFPTPSPFFVPPFSVRIQNNHDDLFNGAFRMTNVNQFGFH